MEEDEMESFYSDKDSYQDFKEKDTKKNKHKQKDKDKEKHKNKDKDKNKNKDKHKNKDEDKEKHKNKDNDGNKHKDKDKDKNKNKDNERHKLNGIKPIENVIDFAGQKFREIFHIKPKGKSIDSEILDNTVKLYNASRDQYGIYPYSRVRRFWEYTMLLMSCISLMEIPFDWLFDFPRTKAYVFSALALDAFYFADLYVFYHTGILVCGIVRTDKESIMKSLKRWKKFIYWIVPWPFYIIGYLLHNNYVYDALVLLKFLRILRLVDAHNEIRNKIIIYGAASTMYILLCYLLLIVQYLACTWWAIGKYQNGTNTWLIQSGVAEYSKISQYFRTYYYITTTITTIGYGDLHPYNFNEILIFIFIELIGCFYYNFFISMMVTIVADPLKLAFYRQFRSVYQTLKSQGLDDDAIHEVLVYSEYIWDKDKDRSEFYDAALTLPISLQKRLELALHMEVFNMVNSLKDKPDYALEKVAFKLKPRIFSPGENLIVNGQVSKKMIFVKSGKMSAYSTTGSLVQTLNGTNGCVLGEPSLLLGRSETVTVIADTFVEAFILTKEDYDDIPEIHPQIDDIQNNPVLSAFTQVHL